MHTLSIHYGDVIKGVMASSNNQPHDCLLNRLFRHRSKKISKLRVTVLCEGISPVTDEFPAQRASNAENASIWWRHNVTRDSCYENDDDGPKWRIFIQSILDIV